MGHFRNCVVEKTAKNKKMAQQEELDGFLNQIEFEELKNYDDYNTGDLLLVFPNPDNDDTKKLYNK